MFQLYKIFVWPHLGHAVKFWLPQPHICIYKIEKSQSKATKMIQDSETIATSNCPIKDLELNSFVQMRLQEQLIGVFKYLNRFNN